MAIKYKLDDEATYNLKGYTLSMLGKYEAAIKNYDLAINHKLNHAAAYCNKGASFRT